jgi:hypothetical protein
VSEDNRITPETRQNILDWLRAERINWAGRLGDEAFLNRVIDLDSLPSTDPRFSNARQDLRQHREFNSDWDDDWIFSYSPLSLLDASDELFGKFLTELVHPVVRPDTDEARNLATELNDLLASSGVVLDEASAIGKRPVWALRPADDLRGSRPRLSSETDSDSVLSRIWDREGLLRLFLSHAAEHEVAVSALKRALRTYGVSAFVAHQDIEPTLEWQSEIQVALASAHSLAALITPEFHASKWTDQEVGIGIGRGLFVFAVQLPTSPYGFLGILQGLRGDLSKPSELAMSIVDILLKRSETKATMHEALVVALENSENFSDSNITIARIESTTGFSQDQLERMRKASDANYEVANSFAVRRLHAYLDKS